MEVHMLKEYIYGARDVDTGKLVSDITNPRRKYWDKRGNAERAIDDYNQHAEDPRFNKNRGKYRQVELVVFELVEVKK
jgi:hypothetical protein